MAYVTATELLSVLKIRNPTAEQTAIAERCVDAAAVEIDSEIDLEIDPDTDLPVRPLSVDQLTLAAQVNIDRAVEHWQQAQSPFGLVGLGTEAGGILTARDSWERHANKLAPLKDQWGLA